MEANIYRDAFLETLQGKKSFVGPLLIFHLI